MAITGSSGGGASGGAIRAGGAFVELFTKDASFLAGLKAAEARFRGFASGLGRIGSTAVGTAAGVLGAGFAAAVGDALNPFAAIADTAKISTTAKALGLTAQQFSGIAGVAKSVGEDTREFIESLVTLGKVASEGAAGKGEVAVGFFKDLNLSAAEFKRLDPAEQFFGVFEALQKVEDPLVRVRTLMVAFGEDGGKYLLPLLSKTPAELRRMADGFAVSAKEAAEAERAQQELTRVTTGLRLAWSRLVLTVSEAVDLGGLAGGLADGVADLRAGVGDATDYVRRAVGSLAGPAEDARASLAAMGVTVRDGLGEAAAAVGPDVLRVAGLIAGVGVTAKAAAVGAGVLGTAVAGVGAAAGVLLSPVGLLFAAIVAGGYAFLTMTESGKKLEAWLGGEFGAALESAKGTAETVGQGIRDALAAGDLAAAWRVATAAVELEWVKLVGKLSAAWNGFKADFLAGNQVLVREAGVSLDLYATRFTQGLIEARRRLGLLSDEAAAEQIRQIEADRLGAGRNADAELNARLKTINDQKAKANADAAANAARAVADAEAQLQAAVKAAAAAAEQADRERADAAMRGIDERNANAARGAGLADAAMPAADAIKATAGAFQSRDFASLFGGRGDGVKGAVEKGNGLLAGIKGGIDELVKRPAGVFAG